MVSVPETKEPGSAIRLRVELGEIERVVVASTPGSAKEWDGRRDGKAIIDKQKIASSEIAK